MLTHIGHLYALLVKHYVLTFFLKEKQLNSVELWSDYFEEYHTWLYPPGLGITELFLFESQLFFRQ